jgi:hypothetical protein
MLMASPALEKEYCHNIGYLEGLKFIQRIITKEEVRNDDEEELSETIFRSPGD